MAGHRPDHSTAAREAAAAAAAAQHNHDAMEVMETEALIVTRSRCVLHGDIIGRDDDVVGG